MWCWGRGKSGLRVCHAVCKTCINSTKLEGLCISCRCWFLVQGTASTFKVFWKPVFNVKHSIGIEQVKGGSEFNREFPSKSLCDEWGSNNSHFQPVYTEQGLAAGKTEITTHLLCSVYKFTQMLITCRTYNSLSLPRCCGEYGQPVEVSTSTTVAKAATCWTTSKL